ncbi:MAG: nicotinate-nucleotide--dimethylbenzimidazole phosphoribosyltransferase [Negativicutes bacterium]|nr:nicotinate-nucleotide--dimethylbenzimidazole phosphoribosyltransferase [Negativicutes bacterium]
MELLQKTLAQIHSPDNFSLSAAARLNCLRAFGRIEQMTWQYMRIRGKAMPEPPHCTMVVACADHGVARNGLSAYPVETTMHMTANYLISQGASANAFANFSGSDMVVVDVGVAGDLSNVPGLRHRKIAWGTQDFTLGPAMSREQAIAALEAGIEIVDERVKQGYTCFSLGEMGIGNTTSSAAIVGAFTGLPPEKVTGRGTGISDSRMKLKIEAVRRALAINLPDPADGIDVLAKVGGFELGALAGVVLGAAANRCAVIIDGLNTTAAALIANAIHPASKEYILPSHLSGEPGHILALKKLGLTPCLDMGVRLGEAIGASVVVKLLKMAFQAVVLPAAEEAQLLTLPPNTQGAVVDLKIRPLDQAAMAKCQLRLDNLTKPLGSLHSFEQIALRLAGITGNPRPQALKKSLIVVNGRRAGEKDGEAISPALQTAAACAAADLSMIQADTCRGEITKQEMRELIRAGSDAAFAKTKQGTQVIGLGVAGVGGAAGAAVTAYYEACRTDAAAAAATAPLGAAMDEAVQVLGRYGNAELAMLAGMILGAAAGGCAVVLDGPAVCAAALIAVNIRPEVQHYLIGAHYSRHPAQRTALELLGIPAYLYLDMEGDDGCGAALGMLLIDAALHVLNDMKTFGEAEVAVAQDGPGALRQSKDVRD